VRSLQKAKVELARAVFILSSDYTDRNSAEVDSEAVMRALSLKKYHRKAKIFAQVVLPPNKEHFDCLGMLF
jgi:hypothetical protein